jgi:hypothetical protein
MLRSIRLSFVFLPLLAVPGHQPLQLVAVRAVALESVLVEKALGATPQADLVAMPRCPYGPAHTTMPATTEQHSSPGQTCSHDTQRPEPAGALGFGGIYSLQGRNGHCQIIVHRTPRGEKYLSLRSISRFGRGSNGRKGVQESSHQKARQNGTGGRFGTKRTAGCLPGAKSCDYRARMGVASWANPR